MMRSIERLAVRAELPLAYTQGFNPRPKLSIVCPRPVGVATRGDLLVMTLTDAIDPDDLCDRLRQAQPPVGLDIVGAMPLEGKRPPQCEWIRCGMRIDAAAEGRVAERAQDLSAQTAWPIQRRMTKGKRGRADSVSVKTVDLRPYVADLDVSGDRVVWTQRFADQQTARPREITALLAPDCPGDDPAAVTRLAAGYRIEDNIIEGPKAFVTEPTKL